jgi:lipopolysaccharide transport system permease protein
MLHFLLSIPVIILFLFIYGMQPSIMWLAGIPVLLVVQFIITMGFSLAVSALNLFFRDIERIVFIFTSLMFYMTPIIYSEDMVPAEYKTLILSNPLSILFISWRNLLMHGTLGFRDTVLAVVYALIVFSIGYFVYRKLKWRFAEVL